MYNIANKIALEYISRVEVPLNKNKETPARDSIKELAEIKQAIPKYFNSIIRPYLSGRDLDLLIAVYSYIESFCGEDEKALKEFYNIARPVKPLILRLMVQFLKSDTATNVIYKQLPSDIEFDDISSFVQRYMLREKQALPRFLKRVDILSN